MTVSARLRYALVFALFSISAGGASLHYMAHPPARGDYAYLPMAVGLVSALVIPWLFLSKKTLHAGYLLNGFSVVLGTVTMVHYALAARPIWPEIPILWGKFLIGYALFQLEAFPATANISPGVKTVRYPHLGFWVVHLLAVATVYTLGNLFWS